MFKDRTRTYPLEHTVHVTGHSLGGAVAQIIGMWLHKRGKNVQVFSYGSQKSLIKFCLVDNPLIGGWFAVAILSLLLLLGLISHTGLFIDSQDLDWGPDNDNGLISKTDGLTHAIAKYVETLKEQL